MATWFETEPGIFQEEKTRLEELGFVLDKEKLAAERRVEFVGRSKVDPERELRVQFHSGYPSFAPEVIDDGSRPLLTRHHHPQNRAFCLFGPNRVRWDCATMTAVDAVNETEELIRRFGAGSTPALEAEVPEPVSDLLPTRPWGGFLISPFIADGLESLAESGCGSCKFYVTAENRPEVRGVVIQVRLGGREWRGPSPFCEDLLRGQKFSTQNAVLVKLDRTPPMVTAPSGFQRWIELVPESHRRDGKKPHEWYLFVYPEESGAAETRALACTVVHSGKAGLNGYRTFPLTSRHTFARIPGLEPLAAKRVVILGLGAIGSRIAVALAASGVRNFHLVDRDLYDTANAVRHACGVRHFGVAKVEAVGVQMVEANPHVIGNITIQGVRAGMMTAVEEDVLIEKLATADLIIDATASEHAAHWLDHQCHRLQKPRLHATVTSGAWGGDVMRVLPGKTPCWVCQQVAHEMPFAEPTRPGGFFAPGCAHPSFTGNVTEVSVVADLAAAMAIETLLDCVGRDFSGSHIRWFGRSATGAWAPRIEVVSSKARSTCPFCPDHLKPFATSS
jgi:molybdopterin/thiamine biosynthesis adenylyltransferase